MSLYEMRKFVAPEFIFGVGSRRRVGYYARNMMARRVMIVRQDRLIDAFLYASVTPAYLTAALDAL